MKKEIISFLKNLIDKKSLIALKRVFYERRQIDEAERNRNSDKEEAQRTPNLLPAYILLDGIDGLKHFRAALKIILQ